MTNEQYRRFLEANPQHETPEEWDNRQFNQPEQPVVGVSWPEAMAYCRWADMELPSEAQWEAAARGTDGRRYPWGNQEPTAELANYDEREGGGTTPVGAYPAGAGPYGTLDQAGNVWEWCRDGWDTKAYCGRDGQRDPVVLDDESSKSDRVIRGGSWTYPSEDLRVAFRATYPASFRFNFLGFRVSFRSGPEHASRPR